MCSVHPGGHEDFSGDWMTRQLNEHFIPNTRPSPDLQYVSPLHCINISSQAPSLPLDTRWEKVLCTELQVVGISLTLSTVNQALY